MNAIITGAALALAFSLASVAHAQTNKSQSTAPHSDANSSYPSLKEVMNAREKAGRAAFERAVSTAPDQELSVLVNFRAPRSMRAAVHEARTHGFTIEGFRHGDVAGSGGYIMRPGESVDEAIEQYERDAMFFAARDLENIERFLASETNAQTRKNLEEQVKKINTRMKQLSTRGVEVLGMDLRGKASALQAYSLSIPSVRLIEPADPRRINSAIPEEL